MVVLSKWYNKREKSRCLISWCYIFEYQFMLSVLDSFAELVLDIGQVVTPPKKGDSQFV